MAAHFTFEDMWAENLLCCPYDDFVQMADWAKWMRDSFSNEGRYSAQVDAKIIATIIEQAEH